MFKNDIINKVKEVCEKHKVTSYPRICIFMA